jgi:protein transport protein SEC61 subunit alpha
MTFRVLNLVRPFLAVLPDVAPPEKRVPFMQRAAYTVVSLLIYLVCSRLPLYGIQTTNQADPMYWVRAIFASSRGTTMELGISPIVTSGLIIQLLVGSKLLDIDTSVKSDVDLMCVSMRFCRTASQALVGQHVADDSHLIRS